MRSSAPALPALSALFAGAAGLCLALTASVATAAGAAEPPAKPEASPAPAPASAPPSAGAAAPALPADAKIEFSTAAPEGKVSNAPPPPPTAAGGEVDTGPPLRPRHRGLVLETTLGALGFAGQFRHVAPIAYWMHGQLGYEVAPWLMLFGEGELAFTDTSEAVDPSHVAAFSIWAVGGGGRATIHATDRVAFFGQLSVDAMAANVPHDTLAVLGYHPAESVNASFGLRAGVEWYQMDRHLALALQVGARDAQGFQRAVGGSDFPLMWDAGVGFRYVF